VATKTASKYFWGTGRRKTAVARVRVAPGTGQILINGRTLEDYFTEIRDRKAVMAPLMVVDMQGKVDVFANVRGGGFAGQAGAICQGLARALKEMFTPKPVAVSPEGEPPPLPPQVKMLRDSGLLTRDARMKERKKYGLHGARRGTQFSKR
jgi:small subunit ribosomal protein S9